MAAKENLPKGKTQLYCYVKEENKKFLRNKSKEFLISESKILDAILDKVRENGSSFKISQLVKL